MRFRSCLAVLVLAVIGVGLSGCITDPATGQTKVDPIVVADTVSDVADLAESYVVLFTKPGPDQDKLVAEIELARKAADLPALRRILDRLRGQPAAQPATTPASSATTKAPAS